MMRSFPITLQFLTLMPVKGGRLENSRLKTAIALFPLAGLLIGLFLTAVNQLLCFLKIGQLCTNTLLVATLIISTGGLHLDGLADTFDGLIGGNNKTAALKIMRDPHIGTMGVLSIIVAVMLEIALLSEIDTGSKARALISMCVLSRWAMVFMMFLFTYAREEGKAILFFKNTNLKNFAFAFAVTLLITITLWQAKGILIFAGAALAAYVMGKFINVRIGGMTGDSLGAINEITQIITLVLIAVKT